MRIAFTRWSSTVAVAVAILTGGAAWASKVGAPARKPSSVTSAPNGAGPGEGEKKKVIYRSHTQLDFSGETVQGKVRAPEVFYIFQRKRSEERHIVRTPASLSHQLEATLNRMQEGLPK